MSTPTKSASDSPTPSPRPDDTMSRLLITWTGVIWVVTTSCRLRLGARRLTADERHAYAQRLDPRTLDRARVRRVARFPGRLFDRLLPMLARGARLDFAGSRGLTLGSLILIHREIDFHAPFGRSLLFHELVHVDQFRRLGVRGFVREYVRSLIEDGLEYRKISLEIEAYDKQAEWDRAHNTQGPDTVI